MRSVAVLVMLLTVAISGCNDSGITAENAQLATGHAHPMLTDLRMKYDAGGPGSNLVWVTNFRANSVTGYQVTDNGDVQPTQMIAGPHTQLSGPTGIFKKAGSLFVVDAWGYPPFIGYITLYPVSSNGDVTPTNVISGPDTQLTSPSVITVTNSGTVIVGQVRDWGQVLSFAPGNFGDAKPIRVVLGTKQYPMTNITGIATHNGLMYVSSEMNASIFVFRVVDNGNVAPSRVLSGPHTGLSGPAGLALDKAGNLYVANGWINTITEYAPGASGDASPIATLQGPQTQLSGDTGLVFNSQQSHLLVTNLFGGPDGHGLLAGFTIPINGDQAPFMAISGQDTMMDIPSGVAF